MSRAGNTPAARLICDETTAKRLADQLSGHFELSESAVAAFAGVDGRWHVEIHFPAPPDEAAVRQLVAAAGGRSEELTFEEIAAKDWVAASLAETLREEPPDGECTNRNNSVLPHRMRRLPRPGLARRIPP